MKAQITFNHRSIAILYFDETPYFSAGDIAKACGYQNSLHIPENVKPKKSGSRNYVALKDLSQVFQRMTGARRTKGQELFEAIQGEFMAAMPVPRFPVSVSVGTDYENRLKANQIEMEALKLKAELINLDYQKHEVVGRLLERERELAELKNSSPRNTLRVVENA